jgi:hypothetical protein
VGYDKSVRCDMEYTYDVVAEAKAIADKKIDGILEPILEDFDKETKKIVNMFDKVAYTFNNEEEKIKLIKKFEDVIAKKENSKYSEYIKMNYEIDDKFFFIDCTIRKGLFATEQRRNIMKSITIEI